MGVSHSARGVYVEFILCLLASTEWTLASLAGLFNTAHA
jgi:hypothetical protein